MGPHIHAKLLTQYINKNLVTLFIDAKAKNIVTAVIHKCTQRAQFRLMETHINPTVSSFLFTRIARFQFHESVEYSSSPGVRLWKLSLRIKQIEN